jgi:hypothetical protein
MYRIAEESHLVGQLPAADRSTRRGDNPDCGLEDDGMAKGLVRMTDAHARSGERPAIVESLLAAVTDRYSDRFTSEDRDRIRHQIADLVDAAETLRGVPLVNGDEPDLNFVARREDG